MLVLLVFILVSNSFAMVVESTNQHGSSPVLYGDVVAYERDGEIHIFDIARNENSVIAQGRNPFLFGFTVVFESVESEDLNGDGDSNDPVIAYANVRDKKVKVIGVGKNPSVFSDAIFFSTNENLLGVDFNNDGDLSDDIIRYFDISTGSITNTKAVGDFPVANQRFVVFVTDESQVGVDLNADGDKVDVVLRSMERDNNQVANIPVVSGRPVLAKEGFAVFISEGILKILDVRSSKVVDTKQSADSAWISDEKVLYSNKGQLFGLDKRVLSPALLNIEGGSVSLFGNRAVFVSPEVRLGDLNGDKDMDDFVLRIAKEEDVDGDGVFDFIDNCAAVINDDQSDSDMNGVGDACEKNKPVKPEKTPVSAVSETNESSVPVEKKGFPWYWFLLVVLVLPFAAKWGYQYYKKRKKSFGF